MARCTKEEAERTRCNLLDAAEQVFLEKGVGAASLDEIARVAGVTRGAVYWHFENKTAVFDAMRERVKSPMNALFEQVTMEAQPMQALEKLCILTLRNLAKDERIRRVYTILMFKCEQVDPLKKNVEDQKQNRKEAIERFRKIFSHAQKHEQLAPGTTPQAAAIALYTYMSGIFADYLRDPEIFDMHALAPKLMEVFFRGIAAAK